MTSGQRSENAGSTRDVEEAWTYYHRTLDAARARLLAHPFADTPHRRAAAHYLISEAAVVGFNMYVGPRQDYPALYFQPIFLNNLYGWGMPNPDFLYRWAFIDGAKTYRIWGRLNDPVFADVQLQDGFWGDPKFSVVSNTEISALPLGPEGSYELTLSPTPQPGVWIKTDPTARRSVIQMRQAVIDWVGDRPMEIHIDELDRPADTPVMYSEADFADRLRRSADFVTHNVDFIYSQNQKLSLAAGEFNVFHGASGNRPNTEGGNPGAEYMHAVYDIGGDDALIIETELPKTKYWGIQVGSVWWQTADYKFHQSNLNAHTAVIDKDGRLRVVLSHVDPGVPNWLDPVDDDRGIINLRWYFTESAPVPKVTHRVKASQARDFLPADTPVVTPAQRRAALAERWEGVERMYGQ